MQQNRYEDFISSNFNDKKLKGLLTEILGGKNKAFDGGSRTKIHEDVVQAFRFAAKIYVG